MKGKLNQHYFMLLPGLLVIVLFLFYPIIWSFLVSFNEVRPIDLRDTQLFQLPGRFVFLKNYISAFQDSLFLLSLKNTSFFALLYLPITLVTSLGLALLLNKKLAGKNFLRTSLFLPYVISIVSVSLLFQTLFRSDNGLVNSVLRSIGVANPPSWFSNGNTAMFTIALMSSWRKVGYYLLIYTAGLQNIPSNLYEASRIDGASSWQQFCSITMPLLNKINFVIVLLLLVDTFRIFQEVLIMTGGGPNNQTVTVPLLIYNEAFKFRRIGSAAAMSYILFFIVILIMIIQKIYQKRESS